MNTDAPVDATSLRHLAETIAREAGELVRVGRQDGLPESATKSSATDVVTVFDTASERLIVERLTEARPNDALMGEEGADRAGTTGLQWLIDPIDGTTNFLYGLPGYNVSIAVADEHGSLAGAVYLPVTDELFSAARDRGATCNGRPISASTITDLGLALVATGFGYSPSVRSRQGHRAARLLPHIRDLRRLGAAAADCCQVAAGRLDAFYEQYLNPWDTAAGSLILTEAGARVGTFPGAAGEPDGFLAAAPGVFDALLAAIVAAAEG